MRIYKYSAWVGTAGDQTRENVREAVFYLAKPESFNDPFDVSPVFDTTVSEKALRHHIVQLFMDKEGISKTKAERKMVQALKDHPEFLTEAGREMYGRQISSGMRGVVGVCCFTTELGNPAMWAHYADGHRGICLEYSVPDGVEIAERAPAAPDIPMVLQQVSYSSERPASKLFDRGIEEGQPLFDSMLVKSTDWAYEKEWRLVSLDHVGKIQYDPICLTGIIMGFKMPPEHVQEVKTFARKLIVEPRLYVARPNAKKFSYDIFPYT